MKKFLLERERETDRQRERETEWDRQTEWESDRERWANEDKNVEPIFSASKAHLDTSVLYKSFFSCIKQIPKLTPPPPPTPKEKATQGITQHTFRFSRTISWCRRIVPRNFPNVWNGPAGCSNKFHMFSRVFKKSALKILLTKLSYVVYNCMQLYYSQNQFNAPLNTDKIHPSLVHEYLISLAILQHYTY